MRMLLLVLLSMVAPLNAFSSTPTPDGYALPLGYVTANVLESNRVAIYSDTDFDGSVDAVDVVDVNPDTLMMTLVVASLSEDRYFETTYTDAQGAQHTVRTPRASDSSAARRRALEDHAQAVREYQALFPPKPVTTHADR